MKHQNLIKNCRWIDEFIEQERVDIDPEVEQAVQMALRSLDENEREAAVQYFILGATITELAEARGISVNEARRLLYRAKNDLRRNLADFVRKRWDIRAGKLCRICIHPRRHEIEDILISSCNRKWADIRKAVLEASGENITAPQVFKAHLAHMNVRKGEQHESR